jgi:hypothetical protein
VCTPAELVEEDLEGAIREIKAERDGEIEVAGPDLPPAAEPERWTARKDGA